MSGTLNKSATAVDYDLVVPRRDKKEKQKHIGRPIGGAEAVLLPNFGNLAISRLCTDVGTRYSDIMVGR